VRPVLCAALLLLLHPAEAYPAQLSLDSRWDLGGALEVRGGLEAENAGFFWGCGDCGAAVENGGAADFRLGMFTPWLRAGWLSRAGLLRAASNPLGFSPQSDVFSETTGLSLEKSPGYGSPGLLVMPLPDVLGLYCMQEAQGKAAAGCFASALSPEGSGAEGFLSISQPDEEPGGDEWYFSRAPYPGGRLLAAGTRIRLNLPWASLSAALGMSRGERVGPGGFWQLRGSVFGTTAWVTLLGAWMDREYRTTRGTGFAGAAEAAAACGFSAPEGSTGLRYTLLLDHPGAVPRPFRESRELLEARVERVFLRVQGLEVSANVKAEKRISRDEEGLREDSSRHSLSLRAGGRAFEGAAGVELIEPDGCALFLTASLRAKGRAPRLSLDSRWVSRLRESPELTELLTVSRESPAGGFRVQAGIQGLPLGGGAADPLRCVRLRVSWSVSASPVPGQDDLALQ
jgi:hypothetical protein